MLTKKGNAKIYKDCLVFNLPTRKCRVQCSKCYSRRSELRFGAVRISREKNYQATLDSKKFIETINDEIKKSKCKYFRWHEGGDFYSQQYIDSCVEIVKANPEIKFYAYTKNIGHFEFNKLIDLPNFSLINSITPLGYNYGTVEYCNKLKDEHGYIICPTYKDKKIICMRDCFLCLSKDKICFIIH
jgi:hypothetical protein